MGGKIDIGEKLIELEESMVAQKPLLENIHSKLRELLATRPVSDVHVELIGIIATVSNIEMETFRIAGSLSEVQQSLIDLEMIPRAGLYPVH